MSRFNQIQLTFAFDFRMDMERQSNKKYNRETRFYSRKLEFVIEQLGVSHVKSRIYSR